MGHNPERRQHSSASVIMPSLLRVKAVTDGNEELAEAQKYKKDVSKSKIGSFQQVTGRLNDKVLFF